MANKLKAGVNWKIIVFFAVFLALPLIITSNYIIQSMIMLLLYAYWASSWNIIGGFAGQMSIGHSAFTGIGAYVSTVMFMQFGVTPWLGMVAGGLISGVFSVLIGYPTFKLKGVYYTLSTIALVNVLRLLVLSEETILGFKTGAALGLKVPWKGGRFVDMQFLDKKYYYYIILAFLMIVLFVSSRIKNAKTGYYLAAITTNEAAAQSLGINVSRYKLKAQFISAFFTAIGGSFYAQLILFLDPLTIFGYDLSVELTVLAMIGGRGTVYGPLIGALLMVPIKEITRSALGSKFAGLPLVIYGLALMLTVYYFPQGIDSFVKRFSARLRTRKSLAKGGVALEK